MSFRECGAYYIIPKDLHDGMLAEIKELKRQAAEPKRIDDSEARYNEDEVARIPYETAETYIDRGKALLSKGRGVTFPIACAVVMKRELKDARAEIAELKERHARLLDFAKNASPYDMLRLRFELADATPANPLLARKIVFADLLTDPANSVYDPCANGDNGR